MQFIQPDTIIPEPYNPQAWNRYSYTLNNPVRYNDPTGHAVACDVEIGHGCEGTGFGDLTPSKILKSDRSDNPDLAERAIYNYSLTHPEYNYLQDSNLDDTGKYLVVNAIFRGDADYASRQPNFWDRVSASWKTFALGGSFSLAAMIAGGGDVNGDGIGGGTDDAVIYLRTDRNTGNQYIGQSSSYSRYTRRQYEHGYNNPAADYEFEVLGRAKPGTDLDVLEEDYIRLYGGPGVLENKRHQMNDWRYTQAGGTVPLP